MAPAQERGSLPLLAQLLPATIKVIVRFKLQKYIIEEYTPGAGALTALAVTLASWPRLAARDKDCKAILFLSAIRMAIQFQFHLF